MSTPPTVHDSDRKAGKEIANRVSQANSTYYGVPRLSKSVEEETALYMTEIIARHHAEERAAVKKLKTAMKDMRATAYALAGDDSHKILNDSEKLYHAALTALRTASARTSSQSPTD